MSTYNTKNMSKTLPGPLRQRRDEKRVQDPGGHSHNALFGLNLNINFSNLISSGVSFLDHLRKKTPTVASPGPLSISNSSSTTSSFTNSPDEVEQMEMRAFPCVGDTPPGHQGAGHDWGVFSTQNPTWCDLCGDLIWGLFDTGDWQCDLCSYTVHHKCREKVVLDCSAVNQDSVDGIVQSILETGAIDGEVDETSTSSYTTARAEDLDTLDTVDTDVVFLSGVESISADPADEELRFQQDTLKDVAELAGDVPSLPSLLSLPTEELQMYIRKYNHNNPTGQDTVLLDDGKGFTGFIRVEMNLARPINVISGTRPPSIYDIMKEDTVSDKTLTTFYLPQGTEKALHITSHTTTQDVIKSLLTKFRVADNPHKYALYERNDEVRRDSLPRSKSLSRLKMRRMHEEERPLVSAILWSQNNELNKKFVLQENDPGEIQWDQFSLPELKNFLLILDREEAWYKRKIHEKYETVENLMNKLIEEKRPKLALVEEAETEREKEWL